jgi:Copper type II ascorbate-dependent monooxygenase, C-terminal domain
MGRRILVGALAPLCLAAGLAACGDGGGSPGGAPQTATFERIQNEVFNVSCSADSCHSSVGQAGGLILEEGYSWDALSDQDPANHAARVHGMKRVWPGDPSRSFLIAKLTNNLAAGEGFPMPYNATPLDEATIEVLKAWIEAGAPADGVVPGDDGRQLGNTVDNPADVSLPVPARGVQLKITARPVPKGSEETLCHYFKLPSDVDLDVNRIQINVSGGSHHIHLYRPYQPLDVPDGFEVCNQAVDFDKWALVVASQLRKTDWELPEGVAFHLKAGEQLLVQTHFVNVGSLETSGEGKVVMNLQDADPGTITAHAGAIFGQDRDVFVPALSNVSESATCTFPSAMEMIAQTGHYHFRGKRFTTYRWDDDTEGALIYAHEGYADPEFTVYDPPLPFAAGQGLEWECYWENPNDVDYEFGPFTDSNEHCNLFAFYYPTGSPYESITCVREHGIDTTTVREGH